MGCKLKLTGDWRDYPPKLMQDADVVITKGDKVAKDRDGFTPRQATKAEIDAAESVDP
jgi:hypothetical protein